MIPSAAGRAVIAVSGMVGKGTIAGMLRAVLPAGHSITELGWPAGAGAAGLARQSARLRPDVAVLAPWGGEPPANAVARVAALAEGLRPPNGRLVLPAGDAAVPAAMGIACITYGAQAGADIRLLRSAITADAAVAEVSVAGRRVFVRAGAPGRHFLSDALAVLGVVEALQADLALAALAIGRWQPAAGHACREILQLDDAEEAPALLIDDSGSANPASFAAAFEMLGLPMPKASGQARRGRRVAILGDMPPDQAAILPAADVVHCAGNRLRCLWEALPPSRRGRLADTPEALGRDARRLIGPGDIVLVKGGPSSRVARVVDALRDLGHGVRLGAPEGF